MMRKLAECDTSIETLTQAMKVNGGLHNKYDMYTSMENAEGFLLSGHLYFSDGQNWNDLDDRRQMKEQIAGKDKGRIFARCFSCSTLENVAMWMLYAGKHGAMIQFLPSDLKAMCSSNTAVLGYFADNQFHPVQNCTLPEQLQDETTPEDAQYALPRVFLTDVVYKESLKSSSSIRLTVNGSSRTVSWTDVRHEDLFTKDYAWAYEKECRLVIRLPEEEVAKAEKQMRTEWEDTLVRYRDVDEPEPAMPHLMLQMTMPEDKLRRIKREGRLLRSPVYCGNSDFGRPSTLKVKWDVGK